MRSRPVDPRHLDVEAFAKDAGSLEGEWPLASLERLADAAHPDVPLQAADTARWRAVGERRTPKGGQPQTWLHLHADGRLMLVCQRCLGPVEAVVDADRSFLFVAGEDAAAALDADSEDDVLALTRSLDLRELVEDELLLSLPMVPRHDECPEPLELPPEPDAPPQEKENPFAVLAALKAGKKSG